MLPSLFLKSLWYAGSQDDLLTTTPTGKLAPTPQPTNFRSLTWGVGWHNYPKEWWLPCMERFLRKHNLLGLISLGIVATWVREGKRARGGSSGVVTPSD